MWAPDQPVEPEGWQSWEVVVPTPVTAEPPELTGRVVLRQHWTELAYFHWACEPSAVEHLLPAGVEVDTFDGEAWVGLIPFEMRDVRLGPLPPVPGLGSFTEVNVRTYVRDRSGRRAVWFFSLDVPQTAVVGTARSVFGLPYTWARTEHEVSGATHRYVVERRWPRPGGSRAEMTFRVGSQLADDEVSDLGHFLSARWALLTRHLGTLFHGRVSHPRWPLHRLEDVEVDQDLVQAAGLPAPTGPPHAMYSPGVAVELAWLRRVEGDAS